MVEHKSTFLGEGLFSPVIQNIEQLDNAELTGVLFKADRRLILVPVKPNVVVIVELGDKINQRVFSHCCCCLANTTWALMDVDLDILLHGGLLHHRKLTNDLQTTVVTDKIRFFDSNIHH